MANGSVDPIVPGGGGPGKEFTKLSKHVLPLGLYLSFLTLALLACLIWQWPHCEIDSCRAGTELAGGATTPGAIPPPSSAASVATATTAVSAPAAPASGVAAARGSKRRAQQPPPASTPATTTVEVSSLDPASGTIGGGTTVRIAGSGFSQGAPQVRFGGLAGRLVSVESDNALTATTPMHAEGLVDVGVKVEKKEATLSKGFNYICPERTQNKLLLVVVLAGALGGVLHAGRSLFYFVGNRNLRVSWLWMYYLLPLNGAVVGALFFLVMLAGLFSVQGSSAQSFLLIIGVAAIVGMFSEQAIEKLKQISEAILTKVPPSADQKPKSLTLAAVTPPQGPTAGGKAVFLTGVGFAPGATVTFGGAAATGVKVTGERIDAVTPPHAAGKVDVEVCNPDSGMAKKAAAFEYVDVAAPPPPGGTQVPAAGNQAPVGGQGAAAGGPGAVGPAQAPALGGPGAVGAGAVPALGGQGAVGAGPAPAAGGGVPVAGGQGQAAGGQAPAAGESLGPVGGSTTAPGGVGQ